MKKIINITTKQEAFCTCTPEQLEKWGHSSECRIEETCIDLNDNEILASRSTGLGKGCFWSNWDNDVEEVLQDKYTIE